MCGRYTLHHSEEALSAHFAVSFRDSSLRYNLTPTERVRFIFSNADEQRQRGHAHWGLVPHWSKTGKTDKPLFNARAETVLQKPAFRDAFIRGRCLIPASGWYEWRRSEEVRKQPYYLRLETGEPFAFAGLFDVWRGGEEQRLVSCTILTTSAPEELTWLHERMPVVLDYDHYDLWLDRSTPDIADPTELLLPYPAEELEGQPSRCRGVGTDRGDRGELDPRHSLPLVQRFSSCITQPLGCQLAAREIKRAEPDRSLELDRDECRYVFLDSALSH